MNFWLLTGQMSIFRAMFFCCKKKILLVKLIDRFIVLTQTIYDIIVYESVVHNSGSDQCDRDFPFPYFSVFFACNNIQLLLSIIFYATFYFHFVIILIHIILNIMH